MDRDVFRLIILAIGLLIMAGIYFFDSSRRAQTRDQKSWDENLDDYSSESEIMEYVRKVDRDDNDYNHSEDKTENPQPILKGRVSNEDDDSQSPHYQTNTQAENESYRSAEAALITSLNDTVDLDDEEIEFSGSGEFLSPFADDELSAKVDTELEINAALLEPLADPDKDPEAAYESDTDQPPSIILLHLVATEGSLYQGNVLSEAFTKADLRHGSMEIFHFVDYQKNQELFSVANIREPGTFPEQMTYFETDGMILFMQPVAVENPLQVFDKMVECADILFKELGGEILDDKRQPITQSYLQEQRKWLLNG